jgi:hypothetical protein
MVILPVGERTVNRLASVVCFVLLAAPCGCDSPSDDDEGSDSGSTRLDGASRGDRGSVDSNERADRSGGGDDAAETADTGEAGDALGIPDSCSGTAFHLKPEGTSVPNILLVVDHSASMLTDDKWVTMKAALRQVTASLEEVVNWGLMLFPPPDIDIFSQCATGTVVTPVGTETANTISNQLTSDPFGGTPTALSLYAARDYLIALGADPPGYLLLATDGGPGCNSGLDAGTCECVNSSPCSTNVDNCLDDLRTLGAVRDLAEQGIRTFVVGIPGTEDFVELLDAMAISGGTDIDGHHFSVRDAAELEEALRNATGSVVSCTYDLEGIPDDPDSVFVIIDGIPIPRDTSRRNGWDFDDEQTVHLYGEACDRIRDGAFHSIEAVYDCD